MPHLARIAIYPVKSLEPLNVPRAPVLRSGALANDRTFALFDAEGRVINGKRTPLVHRLRARFDTATGVLRLGRMETGLTAAFHVEKRKADLEGWLHEFFSMPVSFRANTDVGFPDDLDSPGPTLISTATLAEVASWFPPLDVEQLRLRFRANLEIDGVPPFWEDRLYTVKEKRVRFRIGDCLFDGNNPCQRCAVPPRHPLTGEAFPDFGKTFIQRRQASLPEWAERSRFNHFYRLAINTLIAPGQADKVLHVEDEVQILS